MAKIKQDFLGLVATLVTATDKPAPSNKLSQVERLRVRFSERADAQVKLIQSAAESSRWFNKTPDGYVISLRNGNAVMTINGSAYFKADTADKAVAFLQAAKQAAKAGELDELLISTQRAKPESVKLDASAT